MNIRFPAIALMGNFGDQRVLDTLPALMKQLRASGATVSIADNIATSAVPDGVTVKPEEEVAAGADLLIAIGGDGSMLYAARQAAAQGVPMLGINRGRLGFLADIGPDEMATSLDEIQRGEFVSEDRLLLHAELEGQGGTRDCGTAFNDIVVKRHDTGRMFDFMTIVDGRYVNTHGGDGLIVATPTGSTAYALSCGGPIVAPGLGAVVLAPICPHTLSDRPIVISSASITEIRLPENNDDTAAVSCDGLVRGELLPGDTLRVRAAERPVRLLHPTSYDYFQILRSKLHWGRDSRNDGGGR